MLKKKMKQLQKELYELRSPESKRFSTKGLKYTFDDWTTDEIRMVVFPEGREFFDPDDETLCDKWDQTDWSNNGYLRLLSVEELRRIRDWLEKKPRKLKGEIDV